MIAYIHDYAWFYFLGLASAALTNGFMVFLIIQGWNTVLTYSSRRMAWLGRRHKSNSCFTSKIFLGLE